MGLINGKIISSKQNYSNNTLSVAGVAFKIDMCYLHHSIWVSGSVPNGRRARDLAGHDNGEAGERRVKFCLTLQGTHGIHELVRKGYYFIILG